MIPNKLLKISLAELSLKAKMIRSQQPEINYAQALKQIQLLKEISTNNAKSKKSRKNS